MADTTYEENKKFESNSNDKQKILIHRACVGLSPVLLSGSSSTLLTFCKIDFSFILNSVKGTLDLFFFKSHLLQSLEHLKCLSSLREREYTNLCVLIKF